MKYILAILVICFLASCGSASYSPLDSYINASIKGDSLNEASKIAAQKFIDSTNNAIINIHLHKY